ncbi:hypothetical protein Bbelb_371760 [Branchiostoma belcheri]|nr:hypothetical protein Bbelb_371760 [Branchiostoma belcheri]
MADLAELACAPYHFNHFFGDIRNTEEHGGGRPLQKVLLFHSVINFDRFGGHLGSTLNRPPGVLHCPCVSPVGAGLLGEKKGENTKEKMLKTPGKPPAEEAKESQTTACLPACQSTQQWEDAADRGGTPTTGVPAVFTLPALRLKVAARSSQTRPAKPSLVYRRRDRQHPHLLPARLNIS